jgi:flagellar biosynthesis/type III secretory pathway chaperone
MLGLEQKLKFNLKAQELTSLWQTYCQEHTQLYELTCEEYLRLLESDIEGLEELLVKKNNVLESISNLDNRRLALIGEMGLLVMTNINKSHDLIAVLKSEACLNEAKQIDSLNMLLLDIIEKIQDQNKKNQVFLNKAILSLKELKESFNGKKTYKTYGSDGTTRSNVTP